MDGGGSTPSVLLAHELYFLVQCTTAFFYFGRRRYFDIIRETLPLLKMFVLYSKHQKTVNIKYYFNEFAMSLFVVKQLHVWLEPL